jgi:hypothetical protein
VLSAAVGVALLWVGLYAAFYQWRAQYLVRASYGVTRVAPAIDGMGTIDPPGVPRDDWEDAVRRTHALVVTLTDSNLLSIPQMEDLRAELLRSVDRALANPDTALAELAAVWDSLADKAAFILHPPRHPRRRRPPPHPPGHPADRQDAFDASTEVIAMSPDTLHRLDAMFAELPIMRADDVPSEAEIAEAEWEIGVPISKDDREFLLRYGGGMVGSYPIFGLRPVDVMGINRWSVLDVTREYRSDGAPSVERWVVISEDHGGNPLGMDAVGAIWIHDHDFGGLSAIAGSIEEYIRVNCLKLPRNGRRRRRRAYTQVETAPRRLVPTKHEHP